VVTLMGGVAVAQALREHGAAAALKWPNDVRVHGRKIAGLLAEAVAKSDGSLIVLGIGANVALREDGLPISMRGLATSLEMEGVTDVGAAEVCAAVLARLRVCYDVLAQGGAGAIVAQWRELSEPWWGREVEVSTGSERWAGTAVAVDEDGGLLIDRPRFGRCVIQAGDVDLKVRRG
jgi:BirA family biotin operon repressor/biotin-[acetyl-CoA-carboxylase] ligase